MKFSRFKVKLWVVSVVMVLFMMFVSMLVYVVDGCKFLFCIVGLWISILQCVGIVKQVFCDLVCGKFFFICNMSGGGNVVGNIWVDQQLCFSMYW